MKKDNTKKEKDKIIFILKILLCFICITSFCLLCYFIFKINIIPNKYLLIGLLITILLFIGIIILLFKKNHIFLNVISIIIALILTIIFIILIIYLYNTYDFLKNVNNEYDTLTYSVVVLNDSNYSSLTDLNELTITYLDDDYSAEIENVLQEQINYNEELNSEFSTIIDFLMDGITDAIVLEESYLTLAYEEVENFQDNTNIIYTFSLKVASYEEESNVDITNESFILYISGIDQYGNITSVRGRSDVNQLVVVNPTTYHILFVNTPRDYYVQLDGTTGLKDKLTHAGIYGIEKSMKTLENLYSIDIKYYLRVNFNTVIKIVDLIDGIDIYSDKTFIPWTDNSFTVYEGWNHFSGSEALAYARERKTYSTGDNHRGENQQQVMTAILEKVTSSTVLISKYNSILNALNGSFQTNMTTSEITSFIKYQLEYMPEWTIESIAVTGYDSYNYTYSMGTKYKLYVMEPNYDSVNEAIEKINAVLNETNEEGENEI